MKQYWIILYKVAYGTVTLNCSFYYDPNDDTITKLARGLPINDDVIESDSPSTFEQYSLFLTSPSENTESSFYFEKCYTLKRYSAEFLKTKPTTIDLQFLATNRNRFKKLYYKRTVDYLVNLLGTRSPL